MCAYTLVRWFRAVVVARTALILTACGNTSSIGGLNSGRFHLRSTFNRYRESRRARIGRNFVDKSLLYISMFFSYVKYYRYRRSLLYCLVLINLIPHDHNYLVAAWKPD